MNYLKDTKKYILYVFFVMCTTTNHAHISTQTMEQSQVAYLYGPQGLNVPVPEYQKIETLLATLDQATTQQQLNAIPIVIHSLEKTLLETNLYIEQQYRKQEIVPLSVFFKTYSIQHQISYLKNVYEELSGSKNVIWRSLYLVKRLFEPLTDWISSFFTKKTDNDAFAKNVAQQIIEYINFEREHILFNYQKQILFFTSIKKNPLPIIINFWSHENIQRQMYLRAQQISERVVPQFGIDTIVDFAIQGILMAGGSMAIQWVDQDDATTFEALEKVQSQIQQEWSTFMSTIQKQSQQVMSSVLASFKTSLQTIQQEYSVSNLLLQQEIQYLMRSLSLAQPKQTFLVAPLTYDLAFEASPMATPTPHVWYNIAQKGDWQYDASTNSFWQNGLQLFGIPSWKTDPETKKNGEDVPEFNSIFTESILNGAEYEIEAECTIYTASGSPFFAGIMFNKAHWISGDPERLTMYRLFGMYGSEKTPGDSTTQTIDAVFAQQQIIPAKGTSKEQIISPIQLIDTQASTHVATNVVSAQDLAVLNIEPLTFVYNITTKPGSVTCTLSKQETDTQGNVSLKQLAQKTIPGLDTFIFLYHGIGFMAPGCQASFKLTKPVELVYTQAQIQAYKTTRSS